MDEPGFSAIGLASRPWEEQLRVLARFPGVPVGLGAATAIANRQRLPEQLASAGVGVSYLACALATPADSDDRVRLGQDLDRLRRAVEVAAAVGARFVCTTSGPAGRLRWEDALDARSAQLADVVDAARAAGVGIALENTHSLRSELGFLHTLRDTVAAARHLGAAVCADFYCCWAERGLAETLVEGAEVIAVAQYADFVHGTLVQPNRWVPGDGDLPLDRLVDAVAASGFAGVHEVELLGPRIESEGVAEAIARGLDWLRQRRHGQRPPGRGAGRPSRQESIEATTAALRGQPR